MTLELPSAERGKRVRHPIYGRSADEVRQRAKAVRTLAESSSTKFLPSTPLKDWVELWIGKIAPTWDETGRRTGIKHSSWRGYEKHVRLNIVPLAIGVTPLDRLSKRAIREWLAYLASDQRPLGALGPRSVKYAFDTLRKALKAAKGDDLIVANSAEDIQPPSQTAAETTIFTLEEARTFLKAIRGHRDEALMLVSVFAGPRQGEVLSLTRDDIDLARGVVSFLHTLDWINGRPVSEEPKNRTSRRSVYVPPYVIEVLRRHLDEQALRIANAGAGDHAAHAGSGTRSRHVEFVDYGLVFTGEKGQALRGATVYRRFQRLLVAHDLPAIRWHDLRHSAASIMLALGLSPHTVQKTIGHASLKMLSERYGHLVPELAALEVAKIEAALVEFEASP